MLPHFLGEPGGRAVLRRPDAGIVIEDVQRTEPPAGRLHERGDVAGARDVGANKGGCAPFRCDPGDRLLPSLFVPIAHDDSGPLGREQEARRAPDPAAAAGDEGNLPLQAFHPHSLDGQ